MFQLRSILINSGDPEKLRKFYSEVFEQEMNEMMGWVVGGMYIGVLDHSEVKGKNEEVSRVMFNLETHDVRGEFERLSKIDGISVVKEPYQMEGFGGWIATLADPDGNYFQLVTPWEESSKSN